MPAKRAKMGNAIQRSSGYGFAPAAMTMPYEGLKTQAAVATEPVMQSLQLSPKWRAVLRL